MNAGVTQAGATDARAFNFNAGPAVLPVDVLEEARENLLNYRGSGMGIMELSHRGEHFEQIISEAESALRRVLDIGSDYEILFTTGGATMQFSMLPMNLLRPKTQANFLLSGSWSELAAAEAKKFGSVHIAGSSKSAEYRVLPQQEKFSDNPAYLHFTSNNTIVGTQYSSEPESGGLPLCCDASSDLLSRRIDVNKYAMIYAGAQKNLGAAGVTIVILRKNFLQDVPENLPVLLDYRTYIKNKSLYNTPPTFSIYILGRVLHWIEELGGLEEIELRNQEKAKLLYNALDRNDFYQPFVDPSARSAMNVTFRLKDRNLESKFIAAAESRGLHGLKGHRLIGGIRASIYNACPLAAVQELASFMQTFSEKPD